MQDNELLLFDRINVIKDVVNKHGEEKFYLSFSGGKDSTVLHYLLDMALPGNNIPRVYINTGIEYNDVVNFVNKIAENDKRIIIIYSKKNIKKTLEENGYPFKSKEHSFKLNQWKNGLRSKNLIKYALSENEFSCPAKLKYQFEEDFKINISSKCCQKLKKEPLHKWEIENKRTVAITGMRNEEGGQRANIKGCVLTDKKGNIYKFHPLLKVNEEFENWLIEKNNIQLCKLYYPPFNFKRTGCKGCPYSIDLQEQLTIMENLLPNERKQCEFIWEPIYKEYRRINYRLNSTEQLKLF